MKVLTNAQRRLLAAANFLGYTGIVFDESIPKFSVSKWRCLVVYPVYGILRIIFSSFVPRKFTNKPPSEDSSERLTIFFVQTIIVLTFSLLVCPLACIFYPLMRKKRIDSFLRNLVNCQKAFGNYHGFIGFSQTFYVSLIAVILMIVFILIMEFIFASNLLQGFVVLISYSELFLIIFGMAFLGALIEILGHNLRSLKESLGRKRDAIAFRQFLDIHQMLLDFNDTFGVFLTILAILPLFETTTLVRNFFASLKLFS